MTNRLLKSDRLTLIASTLDHVRTEIESPACLAALLDAEVSAEWPPGEYDLDALKFFRARMEQGGDGVAGWYSWYAVREASGDGPRALIGAAGYFGPPDPDGTVEIGYSVLPQCRRRGYASEIVQRLVTHAFGFPQVERILAHTTVANAASVAVLARCGFRAAGAGRAPESVRFERLREAQATA